MLGHAWANTPQESLQSALVTWVAAGNGVPQEQVQMVALDPRVPVQPCAGGFSFDYPFVNKESVRVRCQQPKWQLFVKVGFATTVNTPPAPAPSKASSAVLATESRSVVVAASNLSSGQILQPELLKLEKLEADKISKNHYLELSGLEGQELVRPVRAGEAIRLSDLRPSMLVRRGEQVLMTVGAAGSFQISVKAEALQDGRMGEQVKLRNTESGRTLSAIVTGKAAARGI